MIEYDKNFDNDSILPFLIHPESDSAQGQVQFCHNLIEILFEKEVADANKRCKHGNKYKKTKS